MIHSETSAEQKVIREHRSPFALIKDLIVLFKGIVLIANVLPVFTGFWLALFFTGSTLANHATVFLATMIGSTMVMAGALALNNWYEADIDAVMARTQVRPTVNGNLSLKTVLWIGISLSAAGTLMLMAVSMEAAIYALIGWVTYVIMYTMWTKRKYTLNTVIGSISGAVTPLIGWSAVTSSFHIVPIVLFIILFIWQMPHTFAIAMKRFEEYKAAGVAMLPVVRGFDMTKRQIFVYVACLVPLPFFLSQLGMAFFIIATALNIAWLILAFTGFFVKDDVKWARINFVVSVNYIAILFVSMILVTSI